MEKAVKTLHSMAVGVNIEHVASGAGVFAFPFSKAGLNTR
jgi:hypothetical protein